MIHGETRRQRPYVWVNLPTIEDYPDARLTLKNVGNQARQENQWKNVAPAAAQVGVVSATTATVIGASILCPPAGAALTLAWPFASALGVDSAAEAVSRRLSKEVPRILGTSNSSINDETTGGLGTDENGGTGGSQASADRPELVYQPEVRHVRRRNERDHRGHRRARA